MKPSHVLAAAVISLSTAHPATADTWRFSYSGFYSVEAGAFMPSYRLSGSFSGADTNHDNRIDRSELTNFAFDGSSSFFECPRFENHHDCNLSSFSYTLDTKQLHFESRESSTDPEGFFIWYTSINTGNSIQSQTYFTWNWRLTYSSTLYWTDQTVYGGDLAPVPEPETYAMLLAGLGLIGGAALRRKTG